MSLMNWIKASYKYTYHIKNTGVGYISGIYVSSNQKDSDGYYKNYASFYRDTIDPLFKDAVIPANSEVDIDYSFSEKINNTADIRYTGHAYFDFAYDVEISGTLAVSKKSSWNAYTVDMTLSGGDNDKYNYGAILKLTYDGNEHYVHVDKYQSFAFATAEDFSLSKLTKVEAIKITRSVSYGYGCHNVYNALKAFAIFIFFCFIFLVCCGIFCAIFFPIMKKKRRERRAAQLANQKNDSSNNDK